MVDFYNHLYQNCFGTIAISISGWRIRETIRLLHRIKNSYSTIGLSIIVLKKQWSCPALELSVSVLLTSSMQGPLCCRAPQGRQLQAEEEQHGLEEHLLRGQGEEKDRPGPGQEGLQPRAQRTRR
jgi:hypothetical protein